MQTDHDAGDSDAVGGACALAGRLFEDPKGIRLVDRRSGIAIGTFPAVSVCRRQKPVPWMCIRAPQFFLSRRSAMRVRAGCPLGRLLGEDAQLDTPAGPLAGPFVLLAGKPCPFYSAPFHLLDVILGCSAKPEQTDIMAYYMPEYGATD